MSTALAFLFTQADKGAESGTDWADVASKAVVPAITALGTLFGIWLGWLLRKKDDAQARKHAIEDRTWSEERTDAEWIRAQRVAAYSEFLAADQALHDVAGNTAAHGGSPADVLPYLTAHETAYQAIALLAAPEVVNAATSFRARTLTAIGIGGGTPPPGFSATVPVAAYRAAFVAAARASLGT